MGIYTFADRGGQPLRLERTSYAEWGVSITAAVGAPDTAAGSLFLQPIDGEGDFVIRDVGLDYSLRVDNSENDVYIPSGGLYVYEDAIFNASATDNDFAVNSDVDSPALFVDGADSHVTVSDNLTVGTFVQDGVTTFTTAASTGTIPITHGIVSISCSYAGATAMSFAARGAVGQTVKIVIAGGANSITIADDTYQDVPSTLTMTAGDTAEFVSISAISGAWRLMNHQDNTP